MSSRCAEMLGKFFGGFPIIDAESNAMIDRGSAGFVVALFWGTKTLAWPQDCKNRKTRIPYPRPIVIAW